MVSIRIKHVLLGGLALCAFFFVIYYVSNDSNFKKTGHVVHDNSIAILPFVNLNDNKSHDLFTDGLTEGVINSLSKIKNLKVSARNSSFAFSDIDVDSKTIGQRLSVKIILKGTVNQKDGFIDIETQMFNAEDGIRFWSHHFRQKSEKISTIPQHIATTVMSKLEVDPDGTNELYVLENNSVDPEAYKIYLQARSAWNARTPDELRKAIKLFERAIKLDSSFAAAYSGLADSYTALGYGSFLSPQESFVRAKGFAEKAISLNRSLAEPHASMAYYHLYYSWDYAAAEDEFRTALSLNPNYSLAFAWYGYYLTAMERYSEAKVILEKANDLDPFSVAIYTDMGFSLYYSNQYDLAIKKLKEATQMNPKFALAHFWLGRIYQQLKRYPEAINEFKITLTIIKDWPVALAGIGNIYGISGNRSQAVVILNKLDSLSSKKFVTPYGMALVYAGLGENDKAFQWLNRAFKERSNWLIWLGNDPRWESLRKDKRFSELLAKVALTK